MNSMTKMCGLTLLVALCPFAAQADPASYRFSTGTTPGVGSDPQLASLFGGLSVKGTFDYDADTPMSGEIGGGQLAGSYAYNNAITNLSGSVVDAADFPFYWFSDSFANAIVGDEKYTQLGQNPPPPADILNLAADPLLLTGTPRTLVGFEIGGFTLVNVRLFWIEDTLDAPDFLVNQDLPAKLPTFKATLSLDFTLTDNPGALFNVFFQDSTVAPLAMTSEVDIDIRPLDSANRLFPRFGLIPVAIFGSETFDALQIDPGTLELGPGGASALPWALSGRDINRDGFPDLLVIFRASETGLQCGDTEATLTGNTYFGEAFSGTDPITTVGCRKGR